MKTKKRPLFLVVTDPVMTLDYLNKNTCRVHESNVRATKIHENEYPVITASNRGLPLQTAVGQRVALNARRLPHAKMHQNA